MPGKIPLKSIEQIYPPTESFVVDLSAEDYVCDGLNGNPDPIRLIQIGTAGILKYDTPNSTAVEAPANCFAVGVQHMGWITKIYKDGTTADEILAWR